MTAGRRTAASGRLSFFGGAACAPGLAHKTKHEMTKHLALFASLGRLTLSWHIFRWKARKMRAVWRNGSPTDRAAELSSHPAETTAKSAATK